jgi:CheY-like chemotaxis protein
MVISFTLKQAGILSDIAGNGKEAVDMLEQQPGNRYDLIIMDLQMPEMDGFETTRYLRKQLNLQVPVVAMTASTLQEERVRCLEAGMNEYMSKPFVPADLFNILDRLLLIPAGKVEMN